MLTRLNDWLVKFGTKHLVTIKRCGYCQHPLDEQRYGVDGAICDGCVEIHAPWMNENPDPLWLALMSDYGHPYYFGDPYNPAWDEPF